MTLPAVISGHPHMHAWQEEMTGNVDYEEALSIDAVRDYAGAVARLVDELPQRWLSAYYKTCPHDPNVLEIEIHGLKHLLDFASDPKGSDTGVLDNRLVAAFGVSRAPHLFPQRPELDRGWSSDGTVFRQMEQFAATHPGTFLFVRPIYTYDSWTALELEYGILLPEQRLWVERFAN